MPVAAVRRLDLELERSFLGDVVIDEEQDEGALGRPGRSDGVGFRDDAVWRDRRARLERELGLELDRFEDAVGPVENRVARGAAKLFFALVLDLQEDAEVAHALRLLLRALEVGRVLGDVGVEEAGDRDVVDEPAELERLALDDCGDLLVLVLVAAAGDGHSKGENGQKADDGGDSGPHARQESISLQADRSPPATAMRSGGASLSATSRRRSSAFFKPLPRRRSDAFASLILSMACSGSVQKVTWTSQPSGPASESSHSVTFGMRLR